jgi:hypothetical protein
MLLREDMAAFGRFAIERIEVSRWNHYKSTTTMIGKKYLRHILETLTSQYLDAPSCFNATLPLFSQSISGSPKSTILGV